MADCGSAGKVNSLAAHANVLYPPAVARALNARDGSRENIANPPARSPSSKKLSKRSLPRQLAQLEPHPLPAGLLCGCLSGFEDVRGGVAAAAPSVSELSPKVHADSDEKLQSSRDRMLIQSPSQSSSLSPRQSIDTGSPQQQIKGPYSPVLQQRSLHPLLHPLPRSARAASSSKTELARLPKVRSARRPVVLKGLWYEGPWVLVPPAAVLAEGVYKAPVVPGVLPMRHRRPRKRYPSQPPQGTQQPGCLGHAHQGGQPPSIAEGKEEEDSHHDDHAANASEQQGANEVPQSGHDQASNVVQTAMSSALDTLLPCASRPLSDASGGSDVSECCDVLVKLEAAGGVNIFLA